VLDGTLNIVSANASAVALCGPRFVAAGRPLRFLFDLEGFRLVMSVLVAAGPPAPIEVHLRAERGPVAVQLTAQAVDQAVPVGESRRGRRIYFVAIVDVSEIRRLEGEREALEREQRRSREVERAAREAERTRDDFIAMLSHELRTPLTPVLAAVGTIEADRLPAPVREAIALIRRNVHAEARLIDDLIDVARIRQGRLVVDRRAVALHDLLTQVLVDWQPEAARRGLAVELARSASEDVVSVDRDRMAQVLRNILGNATKFSDPGGRVTVRTSDADGRIRVTVTDTGTGMTSDQLERLFQTFAEARRPAHGRSGLGLGLATSRGIVEAHGGRIQVTSAGPGEGTTVGIVLDLVRGGMPAAALPPVTAFAALPPPPPSRPAPQDGEKPRVLLVEDHEDSAATLAMVLKIKGYRVKVARTVAEARGKVGDCDVLVSDISLPDGSGLDILREARRRHGDVKAIAVSGYGTEEDVRRSAEAGFAEHLVKPFDPERLIETIERLGAPVGG
jgi:signal transduction histidine kinase